MLYNLSSTRPNVEPADESAFCDLSSTILTVLSMAL